MMRRDPARPARCAHHRSMYRVGPHQTWLQRKAYHLAKLFRAARYLGMLLRALRPVRPGVYQLEEKHLMPQAREAFADAALYLEDETGDVWT